MLIHEKMATNVSIIGIEKTQKIRLLAILKSLIGSMK
jgi:hypothetical protein